MSELGSIYGDEPAAGVDRGRDLHAAVAIPRTALGDPQGFVASIPETIIAGGEPIARQLGPGGPGVRLFLPATLPQGAVLRLRHQGGQCEAGMPGDLFVEVSVAEEATGGIGLWGVVLVVAGAIAGALAFF